MIKDFLESVNLFYDVKDSVIEEISNLCQSKTYPKNSMIILEEEFGDQLFIVRTGTVKITRVNDEGLNLGLHEMAHALQLENIIMNDEFDFMDSGTIKVWQNLAIQEIERIKSGEATFFREYAATNHAEFFAVAVENFFERPKEFSTHNYALYKTLTELLQQDPLLLG
tara:strand:- start:752 stop:1255 length:504 start_codon:yes stop_codon:yes gene_type:complete